MSLPFMQTLCLAANIYFEARGEPVDGQLLVAEVTLNRVEATRFEDDVCGVVFEEGQFSWTDTDYAIDDLKAFAVAYDLADSVLTSGCVMCSDATYYHEKSIRPYWARHMVKLGTYGNHTFYKERDK